MYPLPRLYRVLLWAVVIVVCNPFCCFNSPFFKASSVADEGDVASLKAPCLGKPEGLAQAKVSLPEPSWSSGLELPRWDWILLSAKVAELKQRASLALVPPPPGPARERFCSRLI